MVEFIAFTLLGSFVLQIIFGEGEKEREEREKWELYADDYTS